MLCYVDPDVVWRPAQGPGGMEGNVYEGRTAYERWLREELPEVWQEFRDIRGRGRASGAEVRVPFGQLARYRDGRLVELHGFLDHAGARAAAGLTE